MGAGGVFWFAPEVKKILVEPSFRVEPESVHLVSAHLEEKLGILSGIKHQVKPPGKVGSRVIKQQTVFE